MGARVFLAFFFVHKYRGAAARPSQSAVLSQPTAALKFGSLLNADE
jgi:hypothetical protein